MPLRLVAIGLILFSLLSWGATVRIAVEKRAKPVTPNFSYQHAAVLAPPLEASSLRHEIFAASHGLWLALIPAVTGFLFVLIGVPISLFLPSPPARGPSLGFHFLFGTLLILFPAFYLSRSLSLLFLLLFPILPAALFHVAWLLPEEKWRPRRTAWAIALPYGFSAVLLIATIFLLDRGPSAWIKLEYFVLLSLMAASFLWMLRLAAGLKPPTPISTRWISRCLLAGQILGLWAPLAAAAAILMTGALFPLELVLPLTLFLPLSLVAGVVLARLKQSRIQLVQSEKMATLGNLLAGLAHEINNPLTFIYSNIEPLRDSLSRLKEALPDPGEKVKALFVELEQTIDTMEEGATRAKDIVDNFRYFSFQGRRRMEEMDVNKILDQGIDLLAPKWRHRIRVVRKFGACPKILGFPGEIGQAFLNLLANACEATPRRGTVRVRTVSEPAGVFILIRDTGVGISKENVPRIFDPFFTTKEQGEGTGLGLAIALQIIQKHQGKIEVKSAPGKGTEFTVWLPARPAPTAMDVEEEQESLIAQRKRIYED